MKDALAFSRNDRLFSLLPEMEQQMWMTLARQYQLTESQGRQLIVMMRDLDMWGCKPISEELSSLSGENQNDKASGANKRSLLMGSIQDYYEKQRLKGHSYETESYDTPRGVVNHFVEIRDGRNIMGRCPVASEKTRCCNLHTLDAVFRCGFDCSYCSIQSFYDEGRISFHADLGKKLKAIELDPARRYHIGTGQSSDSLMWGNRDGLLEKIMAFAEANPNIILELKTKSDNIQWLLDNELPWNVVVTWSLNTPAIIENEEHRSASLERRLGAARALADNGTAIGFHFHPMVHYDHWLDDYRQLFSRVTSDFSPSEVVLTSLGTLTYIKPVLKKIRSRQFRSAILQMPMQESAGKYSYPFDIKKEMFSLAMQELRSWQDQVFFYLCMEDKDLWEPVMGRSYEDNDNFELDMLDHYFRKCRAIRSAHKNLT